MTKIVDNSKKIEKKEDVKLNNNKNKKDENLKLDIDFKPNFKKIKKFENKRSFLIAKSHKTLNPKKKSVIDDKIKKIDEKIIAYKNGKNWQRKFKISMLTWSHGLKKETSRIDWAKRNQVIYDFITTIIISVLLALVFFGIDLIIMAMRQK